jgi:hypothetical protein
MKILSLSTFYECYFYVDLTTYKNLIKISIYLILYKLNIYPLSEILILPSLLKKIFCGYISPW